MWKWLLVSILYLHPLLFLNAQQPKTMTLQTKSEEMFSAPSFFSPTIATVKYSDRLTVFERKNTWAHVASEDMKSGWIHLSALTDKSSALYMKHGESDVHLGKKAEIAFRASSRLTDYSSVDKMEKSQIALCDVDSYFTNIPTNNTKTIYQPPKQNISSCQEYYIGRAVTAMLLYNYKPK